MYRRLIYLFLSPHRNAHWGFISSWMWFRAPKYTYCTHFNYHCTILQNTVTFTKSDFLSGYRSILQVNFWKTHTLTPTHIHTGTLFTLPSIISMQNGFISIILNLCFTQATKFKCCPCHNSISILYIISDSESLNHQLRCFSFNFV
jgi:hypothetical protein